MTAQTVWAREHCRLSPSHLYVFCSVRSDWTRVVLFCCILRLLLFWVVFSLCIFMYYFVCQYQSSDWLWRLPLKWPRLCRVKQTVDPALRPSTAEAYDWYLWSNTSEKLSAISVFPVMWRPWASCDWPRCADCAYSLWQCLSVFWLTATEACSGCVCVVWWQTLLELFMQQAFPSTTTWSLLEEHQSLRWQED